MNVNNNFLIGKELPLMEEFYSLQGEGFQAGRPAYFIRLGGCDVGCAWCDVKEAWNADMRKTVLTDKIIENVRACPAKAVVVTGGEPLKYKLDYFCQQLKYSGIETYLETSGVHSLSGLWDWICLSPKKGTIIDQEIYLRANELKVIIHSNDDLQWAEENARKVSGSCYLYLQAEWSKRNELMPEIISYIKDNPKWRISLQNHKYMNIP